MADNLNYDSETVPNFVPNFVPNLDPEYLNSDNSAEVIAPTIVILVFTTLLVPIRLYASTLRPSGRGWDELFLPVAWMFLVGSCALNFLMVDQALIGRPLEAVLSLDEDEASKAIMLGNMVVWVMMILTPLSNYCSRLSIVVLFLRIFPVGKVRTASWGLLIFLTALVIVQVISFGVMCIPIQAIWDERGAGAGARCIDRISVFKSYGVLNIVTDIAIIITPIPTVWALQCSKARKTGIAVTFASGGMGIFASCIRTVYFFRLTAETPHPGVWAATVPLSGWTVVETGMYLVAACFVGMRPFLSLILAWSKTRLGFSSLQILHRDKSYDEESPDKPKMQHATTA